ncbi:SDR family oxidoreductase [Luminiphilus sp.]|nr:SDR family oxidoreductase [Luminiphilus sp.]
MSGDPSNEPVWLVTGASRGIGAAIAARAHNQGCRVAVVARGEEALRTADKMGAGALGIQADVSDVAAAEGAIEKTVATFGRIDVVVNNAGVHRGGKVERLSPEDWQTVLNVNLTGALNIIRAAKPHMGSGASIINIGAVVGFRGFPGDVAYASSKAGLSGMTKALAIEMAKQGITVNLVIPGLVLTDMTSGLTDAAMDNMKAKIPMGRLGKDSEVAEVVYWVSQSRYMTGATVPVDGGLMCSFGVVSP